MTDTPDLVAIGEGMVEFHAEAVGFEADTFRRGFAGDVVNALINASRLGLRCALVSRIGDDAFAPALVKAWEGEGIDLSHAPRVAGPNGIYFIMTDARGERSFIYRRTGSAASQLSPADIDAGWLCGARAVLLSGITQAISATAEAAVAAAAQVRGPLMCYDPNVRPTLWALRGGIGAARAAFEEVAPRMNWLMPSYPADCGLLGDKTLTEDEALVAFAAYGPSVALKCGEDGVRLRMAGESLHVAARPVAKVVDTTGAGDAWNGAFITGLLQGATPPAAAARANDHAGAKLAHRGAIPPRGV